MQSITDIWRTFMKRAQNSPDLPIQTYNTWFSGMRPVSYSQGVFSISVPSELHRDMILKHYYDKFSESLFAEILGTPVRTKFLVAGFDVEEEASLDVGIALHPDMSASRLNERYTFDSFVVGKSNEFAHAVSRAVAEDPIAAQANPLFIYGGVGLGKTHLMHAIGVYMLEKDPTKRVLYVTSEQFTNEFINAIQSHRNEEFREKYRKVDLLLIDDIQFIADKETTMEEFFHTFNELHGANKQIVLTSDRPPHEIKKLQDRLISRFAWGLIVDIGQPDLETRIAILRNKSRTSRLDVPDEVIDFIAGQVKSNIRELEGALTRVIAYGGLFNTVNVEIAAEALKQLYAQPKERKITVSLIKDIVAKRYGINVEQIDSSKRTNAIAMPRQIAMYLSREMTNLSLPLIGEEFHRDHSTVSHAYNKIEAMMKEDAQFRLEIEGIIAEIKG